MSFIDFSKKELGFVCLIDTLAHNPKVHSARNIFQSHEQIRLYVRPVSKKNLLRNINSLSNILACSSKDRPSERLVLAKLESTGVTPSILARFRLLEVLVVT